MSVSSSPPRTSGHGAHSASPYLRISDAERAAVADRLSKHYSDGRLDQAEFDERLDRAMRAKTHADTADLFADLPDGGPAQALPPGQEVPPGHAMPPRQASPRRPGRPRIPFLILIIVLSALIGHALLHPFVPLLWAAMIVFVLVRYAPALRRRR